MPIVPTNRAPGYVNSVTLLVRGSRTASLLAFISPTHTRPSGPTAGIISPLSGVGSFQLAYPGARLGATLVVAPHGPAPCCVPTRMTTMTAAPAAPRPPKSVHQ